MPIAETTVRARKPRNGRQPLTPERIIAAAIELMDEEGFAALSMRKLARKLHVEAMSLYDHFESKDALLLGMRSHFYRELDAALPPNASWSAYLAANMTELYGIGVRHPSFVAVHLYVLSVEESRLRGQHDLTTLIDAGFSEPDAAAALGALVSYVIGFLHRSVLSNQPKTSRHTEASRLSRDDAFKLGLQALLDGLRLRLHDGAPTLNRA